VFDFECTCVSYRLVSYRQGPYRIRIVSTTVPALLRSNIDLLSTIRPLLIMTKRTTISKTCNFKIIHVYFTYIQTYRQSFDGSWKEMFENAESHNFIYFLTEHDILKLQFIVKMLFRKATLLCVCKVFLFFWHYKWKVWCNASSSNGVTFHIIFNIYSCRILLALLAILFGHYTSVKGARAQKIGLKSTYLTLWFR